MKYLAYLLLALTIGFNLWLYYPETQILADPNDNIFQYSLVDRTNWVWHEYKCPLSLSCLPNLVDHVVPTWAEGYPLPFYYSHIPQIVIVSTYNLFVDPFTSISLYQYYNWTKYLLLCFLPLSFYVALRKVGFHPLTAVFAAFLGSHFSTDGLYGIDPPSYLWRGYGLTSQLYAIFFLPLAIAYGYKALISSKGNFLGGSSEGLPNSWFTEGRASDVRNMERKNVIRERLEPQFGKHERQDPNKYILLAGLFLTLTTAGHLGLGIMGFLSLLPFLFFDLKKSFFLARVKKLAIIYTIPMFLLAYWIIPVLLYNNYHMISFWDPLWKFNSYGWYEVIRQIWAGELFDWGRAFPIITALVLIGFFIAAVKRNLFPFALLFSFWILFYFGKTTWGGLIDLIPGMKDFHQHRFLAGVQIAGIFLIPGGLEALFLVISNVVRNLAKRNLLSVRHFVPRFLPRDELGVEMTCTVITVITFIIVISVFTIQQTIEYNKLNTRWIGEANTAYRYDEKNFQDLLSYMKSLPDYRIYAGRPGNWGHDFRLGSTQMYMLFGVNGRSISQFLPETWSPLSENEQNFDERIPEDYDLLNIGYVVAPKNQGFPKEVVLEKKFGPFELYKAPTTGWFDVVTSPMLVTSDKTNFVNIVHLWHRSYARRWKMHPLISVEKNPATPFNMRKSLQMVDEVNYIIERSSEFDVSYQESPNTPGGWPNGLPPGGGIRKNIFSDFPFVFPEATPSGKIQDEKISIQTYSATVDIPQDCHECMVMFKQSYHPNWKVKVDGQDAQKYAVFPFYLAVPVDPGIHSISFSYSPSLLKTILLFLTLFSSLVIFITYMVKIRR